MDGYERDREYLPVTEAAQRMAMPVARVHALARAGDLRSYTEDGVLWVEPAIITRRGPKRKPRTGHAAPENKQEG